jgi:membrane fusion protein, multidrug efflux system
VLLDLRGPQKPISHEEVQHAGFHSWVNKGRENEMSLTRRGTTSGSKYPNGVPMVPLLVLLLLLNLVAGCSKDASGVPKAEDPRKKMAVPVTVGMAVEKNVPVQIRAIGNVEAYSSVSVKAQIEGEIAIVHFKEGQEVKAGDMLFTIDPRPFEVALKQAEANLAKNRAQLLNARRQEERYGSVAKKGFVSQEQYDQIASNADALAATLKADEAAVENAKLKLAYCFIKSPIDGFVGAIRVHKGNLMKANDNDKPMVLINQVKPIYVSFSVPEHYLPEIRNRMAESKLEVQAAIGGGAGKIIQGQLAFIENAVDTNTGSIPLKASFTNTDKTLWPGQFVKVTLTLATQSGAVVVPSQAIQSGQQGRYVFVVKDDSTVEYRPVVPGETIDGETVITRGIAPGERVVTDGQLRLASGSLIQPVEDSPKN